MTPLQVIKAVEARGSEIAPTDDGRIWVGEGSPPPDLLKLVLVHKPALLAYFAANDDETDPAAWRVFDMAYQSHHFQCPQCIAAGKGYGSRCPVGLVLWDAYDANPAPHGLLSAKHWQHLGGR